jgi:hypothetical protein
MTNHYNPNAPQYSNQFPPSAYPVITTQGYPAPQPQPAYAPPAAYPAAPAGYPPQPAAPAGAYDLGQAPMQDAGKNLLPLMPQPGQPMIQRLLALVSFCFNPNPPASKKGPRKPRYEAAFTVVQSSVPGEVGQTYHVILKAAMSQYDFNDYGIAADSRLTRQIVASVNRIDPQAQAPWADLVSQLQTRNFQAQPAVVKLVSNAGRRAEKGENGLSTGQYWPTHTYLPADTTPTQ